MKRNLRFPLAGLLLLLATQIPVAAFAADPDNATAWYKNIESVEW